MKFTLAKKLIHVFWLILFSTSLTLGQISPELLQKSWIMVKLETYDSSRVISRSLNDNSFVRYIFKRNVVQIGSSPVSTGQENHYLLGKNVIQILTTQNNPIKFLVEKLDHENLVLLDYNSQNPVPDNARRFYFVPENNLTSDYLRRIKASKQDTLVATKLGAPRFKGQLDYYFVHPELKAWAAGYFVFSKETIVVKIRNSKNLSRRKLDNLITHLQSSAPQWEFPEPLKDYAIKLPFYLEFGKEKAKTDKFTIKYIHFEPFTEVKIDSGTSRISVEKLEKAKRHAEKGFVHFQNGLYEQAVGEFSKCIALDDYYLDAYFFRAYAYSKLNDLTSACADLTYLSGLDQKAAKSLLKVYCK